jgi:hypothetical protein
MSFALHMRWVRLLLAPILLAVSAVGQTISAAEPAEQEPPAAETKKPPIDRAAHEREAIQDLNGKILPLLKRIKTPVLYEGLPSPVYEKDQLEIELRTKKICKIAGYDFYDSSKALDANGDRELIAALTAEAAYSPYESGNFCTFHPDWCFQWKAGNETYSVLVCLGCHEALFITPAEKMSAYLSDGGFESLNKILRDYHTNRPVFAPDKGVF